MGKVDSSSRAAGEPAASESAGPLPGRRTAMPGGPLPFKRTGDPAEDALKVLSGEAHAEAMAALQDDGGGQAVDASVAKSAERVTGADVSHARVRTDPEAAGMAESLSARAFTVGAQIYMGQGESPADGELVGHELTHVVQQGSGRAGAAPQAKTHVASPHDPLEREADAIGEAIAHGGAPQQVTAGDPAALHRDTVGDVSDRLSYGAFDWAITDSEATEAFQMLIALPNPALATALQRLGETMQTRLLDNLPDSVKATSGYTRLLVAMGPARVRPFVASLLSYGVFDWAVTDNDAEQVFRILNALAEGQKRDLWRRLGATLRQRLTSNLQRAATLGSDEQATLRILFGATPDAEVETLKQLAQIRFRIDFATANDATWDAASLRQLWGVLETLPPSQVAGNPNLRRFIREGTTGEATGWMGGGEVGMSWGTSDLGVAEHGDYTKPGDPLFGVNLFDATVRHEVGHSVEAAVNSAAYCATAPGGTWIEETRGGLAARMVAASGGHIAGIANATQKQKIIEVMQDVMEDRKPTDLLTRLDALKTQSAFSGAGAVVDGAKGDDAVKQLEICFQQSGPWNRAHGGFVLTGRIYQEKYENEWTSYAEEARARQVSNYQFRSASEWFAEAYAAYYEPGPKGAKLAIDGPTKAWFDRSVDPAGGGGANEAPSRTPGAPPPPAPAPPGPGHGP